MQIEWIQSLLSNDFNKKAILKTSMSQYIRETYGHKERRGHPRIVWNLEETVSTI